MSYSLFNRHANMSKETLYEIGDIINEVRWDGSFELTNQLFGLYDGYLYDELLINAENADLPKEVFRRIIKVWNTCRTYPVISRYVDEVEVAEAEPVEYSPNMGIAEGKAYLASIS
ncbi:MAG: hypothetical protein ACO21S_09100 [Sediminibacterium sp.]|jgi:hypothetical protein